jgi:hypothetical protein
MKLKSNASGGSAGLSYILEKKAGGNRRKLKEEFQNLSSSGKKKGGLRTTMRRGRMSPQ